MQKYHMRRKDREIIDKGEVNSILKKGKYVTVAMCKNNEPYIVSLSYGFNEKNNCLYFHAALKGLKLDFLNANPSVCATVILDGGYRINECAHTFQSVVIIGKMYCVETLNEKKYGMDIMLNHLEEHPDKVKEKSLKNDKMYNGMLILKLDIEHVTGKRGK